MTLYLEESIFALSCEALPLPIPIFRIPNLTYVGTIQNTNAGAPLVELIISVLEEGKLQVGVIAIDQEAQVTTIRLVVYLELIQPL